MFKSIWPAVASLFFLAPAVFAEARCPGNVASVHVRHIQGSITIVGVKINHTGPYDFVVDTGSEISAIDPRLAFRLQLKTEGEANIVGVSTRSATTYAHLDLIEIGSQPISQPVIFIREMGHLQGLDPDIRGVIGGNILRHFDVLFEQDKNLLCLDSEGVMQKSIQGEKIPLAVPPVGDGSGAATEPLIAEVHLQRLTGRPLYLLLDSGANVPYLCESSRGSIPPVAGRRIHIAGASGPGRDYVALPPQDIPIGRNVLRQVSFVVPADGRMVKLQVDGMLPTGLFRRVYISYADRFLILEPW
jgi:Aspartyl protease